MLMHVAVLDVYWNRILADKVWQTRQNGYIEDGTCGVDTLVK